MTESVVQYFLPFSPTGIGPIVSDGHATDARIEDNVGIYSRDAFVYQERFADPIVMTPFKTESLWTRVKRKSRRQFSTSEVLFTSHLYVIPFEQFAK